MLPMLSLNALGVGNVFRDVTSRMEKGQIFIKDGLIHLICICTIIENGLGCQKLGLKIH
jgi:hypothetical protein